MPGSVKDRLNNYLNVNAFSRPLADTFGTMRRTTAELSQSRHPQRRCGSVQERHPHRIEIHTIAAGRLQCDQHGYVRHAAHELWSDELGVIDTYASGRGPREMQVAVKFYF